MATITVTKGYNNPTGWISGEEVTPAKLNSAQTPTVSLSDIVNADISGSAAIVGSKLADDSVALAKLVTAVQQALVPAGAVQAFAMNSTPSGWLAADGSNVNRTTYAALFTAIGTTYGSGDGTTTFALPDLRGYFVRGSGTNSDGTAAGTFGAKQADELKSHLHTHEPGAAAGAASGGSFTAQRTDLLTTAINTSSTGGSETRPKNIAMLYCIKF
jgi:microcystin-dependent protein